MKMMNAVLAVLGLSAVWFVEIDSSSFSRICDGQTMTLQCASGHSLNIVSAEYGRTLSNACPGGPVHTLSCRAANVLHKTRERCQDRNICYVPQPHTVFGDPCVGTYKHFDVTYECVARGVLYKRACEGNSVHIQCYGNSKIQIVSAMYGRQLPGHLACPHRSIRTLNCRATTSMKEVQDRCNNEHECKVAASYLIFRDPCVNTYKYLEVAYKCV